jgi:hypothetical protein
MLIERTVVTICVIMLTATGIARAQSAAAVNLHVDVHAAAAFRAGNVTRVSYVVANDVRSSDRLFEFAVRSPVPIWRLEVPTPRTQYHGVTHEGGDDVASWGWLDGMPRPGESSPVLAYEAIGLPGIVTYRALRYFGVRDARSVLDQPAELRFDRPGAEHAIGKTVGVVPLPIDLRPATLARRLRQLVDEACELGWVASGATCRGLRANARPSARSVRVFHRELVAQRGRSVNETAFALLALNAEFLLSKL